MTGKVPHAAFCEEYDEDAHVTIPETRQVANAAAKRSKSDLRSTREPLLVDVASDSGYSSRTAATVNSTQSAPSGWKIPAPLKLDTTNFRRAELDGPRSSRKVREKEKTTRLSREDKMQVGTYQSASHPVRAQRSPSRPRRRESSHVHHYPGSCWDCDRGLYHASTPVEPRQPRQIEYPYYPSPPTPVHDYPPPSPRYPPAVDVHVSRSNGPLVRANRSNSYHGNNRPVSFHGMMPGMGGTMYSSSHLGRYDPGPPLSASAYVNNPAYASSHYSQPSPYYATPPPPPPPDHHQERSVSRTREQPPPRARRPSAYGPPVLDYDLSRPPYEDDEEDDDDDDDDDDEEEEEEEEEPPKHRSSREPRAQTTSRPSRDRDDDYYRMPPPPLKQKATPHIIQKRPDPPRKTATAPVSIPSERRPSRTFDLSEIDDALPDYGYRRSSRETVIPERSQSLRDGRRSKAYHDSALPSRVAIEGARRRRTTVYNYNGGEIEDKQREAEEYQASRAAKSVPVPLTADALYKAKSSHRAESDSGSQKSRSNSSRGSDARTQNGSHAGSKKEEDDNNIVMTMNGVTMSFTQESVGGKRISVRTGDTGAVELNIEGKRPKKYVAAGSDYTAGGSVHSSRREIEDARRPRGDRRSDRASRRSSHSTYGGRF